MPHLEGIRESSRIQINFESTRYSSLSVTASFPSVPNTFDFTSSTGRSLSALNTASMCPSIGRVFRRFHPQRGPRPKGGEVTTTDVDATGTATRFDRALPSSHESVASGGGGGGGVGSGDGGTDGDVGGSGGGGRAPTVGAISRSGVGVHPPRVLLVGVSR